MHEALNFYLKKIIQKENFIHLKIPVFAFSCGITETYIPLELPHDLFGLPGHFLSQFDALVKLNAAPNEAS